MTTPPTSPGAPPRPGEPDPSEQLRALAATVAGLAREVEQLHRGQAHLASKAGRLDELAATVRDLADTVAAARKIDKPSQVAPSWLDLDVEPGQPDPRAAAEDILERLTRWVAGVYLRYSDAKLSACWMWHPDVVEELLWLHVAWLAAYRPDAPVTAAGDWHDRQRPGVVARIKSYAGFCSLEAHQPGQDRAAPAPTTPTADAAKAIAEWWATCRDQPGPAPTAEQLAAADRRTRIRR